MFGDRAADGRAQEVPDQEQGEDHDLDGLVVGGRIRAAADLGVQGVEASANRFPSVHFYGLLSGKFITLDRASTFLEKLSCVLNKYTI